MMIPAKELKKLISKQLKRVWMCKLTLLDNEYKLHPLEKWREFIEKNKTDRLLFIDELNDCDDFAAIFRGDAKKTGMTAGEVTVQRTGFDANNSTHMANLIVTDDKIVRVFEPQNDTFYTNGEILLIEARI